MRLVLSNSLLEILGEDVSRQIWERVTSEKKFPLGEIHAAVLDRFGEKSAAGLMHCAGRAGFKGLISRLGDDIGFADVDFKFLPLKKKAPRGLELLADVFTLVPGQSFLISVEPEYYLWILSGSEECTSTQAHTIPGCNYYSGLLQEYMAWIAGGKIFLVEEISCAGLGQERCIFRIGKTPLE
jgi:predicted hydrocarbon binding protein